uniref:Uncharacterized protein n=1 Tax=Corvus moneduloides TaxID=1196302 RepID=A0A8U7NDH6_CORMO
MGTGPCQRVGPAPPRRSRPGPALPAKADGGKGSGKPYPPLAPAHRAGAGGGSVAPAPGSAEPAPRAVRPRQGRPENSVCTPASAACGACVGAPWALRRAQGWA